MKQWKGIGEVGGGENLFKSRLVQRIGIPQSDALKSADSNREIIPNISPSFGRDDVCPSESYNELPKMSEKTMPLLQPPKQEV